MYGWPLFWLVSAPMSLIMVIAMMGRDMTSPEDVSHMIGFSVRWAVPFIFLVVATSSLQALFPGPVSMWLLRNRKYTGLCFAVAMGWQGLFIFMMTNIHRGYYFEEIFYLRDELEGHLSGLYFLFAYAFSVYWWNLYYFEDPTPIDYVFYWMGFVAFTFRIAAWGGKRLKAAALKTPVPRVPPAFRAAGGALIVFGLVAAATGLQWQEAVSGFLLAQAWSENLELWLPFWPFEPFLPLFIIGLGTLLLTKVSAESGRAEPSPSSGFRGVRLAAETPQHSHEDRNAVDSGGQRKRGKQLNAAAFDDHARHPSAGTIQHPHLALPGKSQGGCIAASPLAFLTDCEYLQ